MSSKMLPMDSSRVWTRRSSSWVALGLLVAMVASTGWLLARGTHGAELANILALPVSLLGLVVAAYGTTQRSPATDHAVLLPAARELAGAVARHEAAVQQRLLSDTGDARPANVGYAQLDAALVRWRTDGGEESGSLNTIADFYQRLDRGRLIVLGKAGAGKTVLALRGLLHLIRALPEENPKPGVRLKVPVRLSLPDWTVGPAELAALAQQAVLAQRLDAWIAAHLVTVYGVRPAVARALVSQGWVVPILDGLDEMDPDDQPPVRAQAVVQALNHPTGTGLRPFLLTCREHRYAALDEVIQDATAVLVQPLSIEQVAQWLTYRFPDHTKPPGIEHRWLKVLRQLDVDRTGPLATCLTSPLRLYLTVTAYRDPTTDPDELLTIPADELDEHLFSHLIPAVVKAHGLYDPDDVTRWLGTLAEHLDRDSQSKTDLNVFSLWRTAARYTHRPGTVRILAALLYTGLAAVSASAALTVPVVWIGFSVTDPFYQSLVLAIVLALSIILVTAAIDINQERIESDKFLSPLRGMQRLDVGLLRTATGRRQVWRRLGFWFLVVTFSWIADETRHYFSDQGWAPTLGTIVILSTVVATGFVAAFSATPTAIDRPGRILRQVGAFESTWVLTLVLTMSISNLAFGGSLGATAAIASLTATFALVFRVLALWPRYLVSTWMLARTRKLPLRLARFLDWAYSAGLLRLSGIAVQFRHIELQNWLTMQRQNNS